MPAGTKEGTRARIAVALAGGLALALAAADFLHPGAAWSIAFIAIALAVILLVLLAPRRVGESAPAPLAPASGLALAPTPTGVELLRQGLRMGMTAFGGAMAVLGAIELELVQRLRWVSPEAYIEAAAFGQSLPGAIANNAMSLLGYRLGGWSGAALLMGGYVLPSFLLMLTFAVAYESLRGVNFVDAALLGLSPAVVAVVASVTWTLQLRLLARAPGESWGAALWRARVPLIVAAVSGAVVALGLVGAPEVVLGCGFGALVLARLRSRLRVVVPFALPLAIAIVPSSSRLRALAEVLGVFLKTGATTFGGGYVMVPVLERELVRSGWIGAREFMDAVALGQITPGPVVITATFVGYRLAGLAGALFGTIAVFAPGFILALLLATSIERMRSNPATRAFLAGLQPAILGVIGAAVVSLARSGLHGWAGIAVAAVAFALLASRRLGIGPVLVGSALLGIAAHYAGMPL